MKWNRRSEIQKKIWIEDTRTTVIKLMQESLPDGQRFASAVERVLLEDKNWVYELKTAHLPLLMDRIVD